MSQTAVKTMSNTAPGLTLTRHFGADRSRVFDALTRAGQLAQWFGPEGCSCPDASSDVRVGGTYRIPIVGTDCETHIVTGEYLELRAPEHISMTWSWVQDDGNPGQRMVVTISLVEKDGGTDLTLYQTNFIDDDARDKHSFGWSSSFNCLEALLA